MVRVVVLCFLAWLTRYAGFANLCSGEQGIISKKWVGLILLLQFFLWAVDDFTAEMSQHVVALSYTMGEGRQRRYLCSIAPTEAVPGLLGHC